MPENGNDDQTIIAKIESIMRLANDAGASDEERDNALKFAERLMTKHKIEMHRLDPEAYSRGEVEEYELFLEKAWVRQHVRLAWAIQRAFYVRCTSQTIGRRGMILNVFGRQEDVKSFRRIFEAISQHMLARKAQAALEAEEGGRSWHYSFVLGYIRQVRELADQIVRERNLNTEETAIVAVADSELDEAVAASGAVPYQSKAMARNAQAYYAGMAAGNEAPLTVQEKLEEYA